MLFHNYALFCVELSPYDMTKCEKKKDMNTFACMSLCSFQFCILYVCSKFQPFFNVTSTTGERWEEAFVTVFLLQKLSSASQMGQLVYVCKHTHGCILSLCTYLLCITCQWGWSTLLRLRLMPMAPGTAIRITLITQGPVTEAI